MDDGERVNPALDRGIGCADLLAGGAAGVEIEQGGDDLEIVLDAVVDLANQLLLPFYPRFQLGLVSNTHDRPFGCVRQQLMAQQARFEQRLSF